MCCKTSVKKNQTHPLYLKTASKETKFSARKATEVFCAPRQTFQLPLIICLHTDKIPLFLCVPTSLNSSYFVIKLCKI